MAFQETGTELAKEKQGAEPEQSQASLKLLYETMSGIEPKMNLCVKEAYKNTEKTTEEATAPCYQVAMKEWDELLNVNYGYLMKELGSWPSQETKEQTIEAERQWIKARDEQFKAIEQWERAGSSAEGSVPEDKSIAGLDQKVKIVQNQTELVFHMLSGVVQGGDPYKWDKPL